MGRSSADIDKLVVVVHGVGDPAAGETLSLFARSIADREEPLNEYQKTLWLPEKSPHPEHVKTFASHIRRLDIDGQRMELAEVFWGDVSRVRRGLLGTILGLFKILFGLRYVAYVAADQPGAAAHWLKRLGLYSSRILHGPVLGITFFLAILTIAVSCTQLMWTQSYKAYVWTQVVLASCCAVALVASAVGWQSTRSRIIERFWFWVNVTAMFVCSLMVVKTAWIDPVFPNVAFTGAIHPGLIWYCRILVLLLASLWLVEMLVLIAMAVCWALGMTHPDTYRPALHAAFLLPALAVGIWGQALPMIWLTAQEAIKKFIGLSEFATVFDEAIPLLGVQLLLLIVMAASGIFVGLRYAAWRKKHDIDNFVDGSRPPRLIVNGGQQCVISLCTIVGISLVFGLGLVQMMGNSYEEFWGGRMLAEANKYAVILLVPLGGIMVFLLPHLRPAFDILLDVINHFHFRRTDLQDTLDDDDEFDIRTTTFESGSLFFSRRDAINSRIKRILTHYRDRLDNRPSLTVVSHSQGTMLAIEMLNDPELAWLKNRFSTVNLVTMGSPFTHLYQHYFRHLYPDLEHPFWNDLRSRIDQWVNIFRIDDFVGNEIDFPRQESEQSPGSASFEHQTVFSNHPVGPRGHQNYWTDCEVLAILRDLLLNQAGQENRNRQQAA